MRYFISLSYKGTSYCGWQIQVNHPSVQAELERAFSIYLGEKTGITGAGRTDTGVHALNYVAHFDCVNPILFQDYPKLIYKINAILPSDITLINICQVADEAHARFDATGRTYKYYIHTKKDSFMDEYSFFFPYSIDLEKMTLAAEILLGEHDFTSMAKLHTDVKTNICRVSQAFWSPGSPFSFSSAHLPTPSVEYDKTSQIDTASYNLFYPDALCFTITANRFLRNMVRAIVGTLLDIGRGKQSPDFIMEILATKNRCAAGSSVPAHALFLTKIEYPYKIFYAK